MSTQGQMWNTYRCGIHVNHYLVFIYNTEDNDGPMDDAKIEKSLFPSQGIPNSVTDKIIIIVWLIR